jgi:hypothetical protein
MLPVTMMPLRARWFLASSHGPIHRYESAPPFGPLEMHYGHGFVATSGDGVHFSDVKAFNAEVSRRTTFTIRHCRY